MNVQRVLIDNGWTIANRRNLVSKVGKQEYNNLKTAFRKYSTLDNVPNLVDRIKLNQDGDKLCFSFGIPEMPGRFFDNDICANNILTYLRQRLGDNFSFNKINFEPSKTMEKLFSPEFAPKRHINEDGYFVTTLIDKKTGKPVEAYVKCISLDPKYYIYSYNQNHIERENWAIYVKNEKDEYKQVGHRRFEIDFFEHKIMPGCFNSKAGRDDYDGIGVRLHQIGVERMLQENLRGIEVDAVASAFPFHYKCGFRVAPSNDIVRTDALVYELKSWSRILEIPYKELEMRVIKKEDGYDVDIDYKVVEEIKKQLCIKQGGRQSFEDTIMELRGEQKQRWIRLAESQPIILDYKKEL